MDASGQLGLHSNTPGYVPLQNHGSPHPTAPPLLLGYSPQQPGYPPQQPGYHPQSENSPQQETGYPEPLGFVIPAGYPNPIDYNAPGNEGKHPLMDNPPPKVGSTPPPSGVLVIGFDPVNMPPYPVHEPPAAPPDAVPGDNAPSDEGNEGKQPLMDNQPPNLGSTPPPNRVLLIGFDPVNMPPSLVHGPPAAPLDTSSGYDASSDEGELSLVDNLCPTMGLTPPPDSVLFIKGFDSVNVPPATVHGPLPDAVPSGGACTPDGAGLDLEAGKVKGFSDKSIQLAFVRKVYAILTTLLLVIFGFAAFCLLHTPTNHFFETHPELTDYIVSGTSFIGICILFCKFLCRRAPYSYTCLSVYTLDMALLLGSCTSKFHSFGLLTAIGMTAAILLTLTLFTFQSEHDFTSLVGMFLALLVNFIIFNFTMTSFRNMQHIHIFSFGIMAVSFFLICDTQKIIGGKHEFSISPEEYIYTALYLTVYLDIFFLFTDILVMSNRKK